MLIIEELFDIESCMLSVKGLRNNIRKKLVNLFISFKDIIPWQINWI